MALASSRRQLGPATRLEPWHAQPQELGSIHLNEHPCSSASAHANQLPCACPLVTTNAAHSTCCCSP